MRSATAFLPRVISTLTNLDTSTLLNLGSGRISRFEISLRRGISFGKGETGRGKGQDLRLPTVITRLRSPLEKGQAGFARFEPYFERPCLRSLTPCVSRLPRTMW